jgi:hypothetical protein
MLPGVVTLSGSPSEESLPAGVRPGTANSESMFVEAPSRELALLHEDGRRVFVEPAHRASQELRRLDIDALITMRDANISYANEYARNKQSSSSRALSSPAERSSKNCFQRLFSCCFPSQRIVPVVP